MAKVLNTFLKSKMNKDLDARIIPSGEYRNAVNVQISKSEGDSVGSVENVLGNRKVFDFEAETGITDLRCIGYLANDQINTVYVFLTNYPFTGSTYQEEHPYEPTAKNYIFACNVQANELTLLVEGAFLNFCTTNPIYGVNILEGLLFWTDNRNQPRKINVDIANPSGLSSPTYYTTEDQISVAKYNPYSCMELYQESFLSTVDGDYESTMKDVVSKFYPNGGAGILKTQITPPTSTIQLVAFEGDIQAKTGGSPGINPTVYDKGSSLAYISQIAASLGQIIPIPNSEIDTAEYDTTTDPANPFWEITTIDPLLQTLAANTEIILNPNPYYDSKFAGDPDFLEDKFSRFSYRFQFEDNEYSLTAPFTQIAFIPKQDGYFMYVKQDDISDVDDQSDAYRSTVVSFVENKVNDILLRIPLPFKNYNIPSSLNIKNIDILYKESDAIAIKVVDTVPINDVVNSAGTFSVNGAVTPPAIQFNIDNLQGGIKVGSLITGFGIVGKPKVTAYEPTDINNPSTGGQVTVDLAQTLVDDVVLNANDPNYFSYNYQSKKPFKTLPEKTTTRVFDKIPVKALAQEVSGNRIIYGNYQDKHTPPKNLNYNVAVSDKVIFNLNREEGVVLGGPFTGTTITIKQGAEAPSVGDFISLVTGTGNIPLDTQIETVTETPPGSGTFVVTLTNTVTNVDNGNIVLYEAGGDTENSTSIIEYPNSSIKTNRNYQAGVVLSDRYGRTSTVLLSNNKETVTVSGFNFSGDTIYSSYKDNSIDYIPSAWPGNSLKLLFNQTIFSSRNTQLGTPGLYNDEISSLEYNPLGWYSYKIVVKQTEQDYYNVYLPGVMASYPKDQTLELGKTSHMVLINDNINKVPRDLSEVGPEQRQFRSSVRLFGRVENTSTLITANNIGASNTQYYPERSSDTVSTISNVADLFEYAPVGKNLPRPNYFPQFYSIESNPLIARISTTKKIGQISTTNYNTVTATVGVSATTSVIQVVNTSGNEAATIIAGSKVSGPGFPEELEVVLYTPPQSQAPIIVSQNTNSNTLQTANTPPVAGSLLTLSTGNGIPEGTIVVSSTAGTPNTLTLSNVVNLLSGNTVEVTNPAQIEVNESVTVTVGSDIVITGAGLPGIQYLAVYETEPQESLLDIFWETSTSGLISDLNNAILNESSGGASLFGFNQTPFIESILFDENVSSSDISIVNNFGSPIPSAEIDSPLEIISQQNSVQPVPETVDYFVLYEISSNIYNIKVNQNFIDDIYFGTNPGLRNFNLLLEATVNGLVSQFPIVLNLRNKNPFFSITNSPLPGEIVRRSPNEAFITNIHCRNGSANDLLSPLALNIELTEVLDSSGVDVTDNNYFVLINSGQTQETGYLRKILLNQGANPVAQSPTPADRYSIKITATDPGGQFDEAVLDFIVDLGVKVENVKTYKWFSKLATAPFGALRGPGQSYSIRQYYTIFQVTEGPVAAQGWYLYNGPWNEDQFIFRNQGQAGGEVFELSNTSVNYANQPSTSLGIQTGCSFVDFLTNGGLNTGFSGSSTGGGIRKPDANTFIIMGGTNQTYPFVEKPKVGSRLIRYGDLATPEAEAFTELNTIWRENCKYINRDPSYPGGLFQQSVNVAEDAEPGTPPSEAVSQFDVDNYFWSFEDL